MSINPDMKAELHKYFRGELRTDLATKILYSTDASIYQIEPLGVAIPRSQDDLQAAVELAAKYKVPVLPRGSGSSLAGQAIGQALILDTSRWLNNLVEIDSEARTATIEPGLILSRLNAAAARYGLTFGPDPASAERATLGGVIGNNATGAHSILYGMTADHLISADVILADGSLSSFGSMDMVNARQLAEDARPTPDFALTELDTPASIEATLYAAALHVRSGYGDAIKKSHPRSWRNSAGYRLSYLLPWSPSVPPQWSDEWSLARGDYPPVDPNSFNLAPLLAGSEGTLAVIRRATVNLVPRPKYTILGVLTYDSIVQACEDVPRLLEFSPSAVELIPQMLIQLAKDVPAYANQVGWVRGNPAALLAVEFSGNSPEVLKEVAKSLGPDVIIAESREDQSRVWSVRKVGLGIFDSRPADKRPVAFIEDCAIPVEKLGSFVRETDRILAAHETYAAYYAHASAGCLHIRPMLDMKHGTGDLRSIAEAVLAVTLRLGGSMSSEHGDGLTRGEFLRQIYGKEVVDAMRIIKTAADPHNLLNPGKMLDASPMDTNLRYGESYEVKIWESALSFERNNGLGGAIEQCNGQGVCRKDSGVMCPSFQATREEGYSTRGRANLLRAMISNKHLLDNGQHFEVEQAAFGTLDLCLACKGCKAECPSGVDMAKLKYEFQHEYYKTHPRKLRDYLFAYIGPLVQFGAPIGSLVNWGMERSLFKKVFKLAKNREMPKFISGTSRTHMSVRNTAESIILLRDTFTHFFEPEIEQAALDVLSACGVSVVPIPYFGAGRTLISKGFIEAAKHHAGRVLDAVQKLDPAGVVPVLGIEPSELYTLRDEFLDLLPERSAEIESLEKRAWLVDEWLTRPDKNGELRVTKILQAKIRNFRSEIENQKSKIHLHGHCYQKAQPPAEDGYPVGQAATIQFLRALGFDVEIIPSGCCGMAGAFGYEEEHYELSMAVGELVLFPSVRKMSADGNGKIAAPGTSCRAQIADGTGIVAQHPLLFAAGVLGKNQAIHL